ncbi:MAG: hypothetical protein GF401_11235 [Chitinivibrionales bacterium]|nr:hypothetical protein [Chitinivibrionales bacterium]
MSPLPGKNKEEKYTPEQTWKLRQVLYGEILDQLDQDFSAMNLQYMPIKGASLICSGLAEKISSRTMNDIDILVLPDRFTRASDYFDSSGTTVAREKESWPFAKAFYYVSGSTNVVIEMHAMLNRPERFYLPTSTLFKRGTHTRSKRVLPCLEDMLLIMMCHQLVHGAQIPQQSFFEEMKLILSQPAFNRRRFFDYARQTGIASWIYYLLELCKRKESTTLTWPRRFRYPDLLLMLPEFIIYGKQAALLRKIFIELPFSRNPWQLMRYKLSKS